jgi:protein-tyrosine phosphatase
MSCPRVLLVCLGNICRSPAAEGVLRARAAARGLTPDVDIVIDSAGTGGWHAGDPPDPRMTRAALARGYVLSGQRARQVTQADFRAFDRIVAMDRANLAELRRRAPQDTTAVLSMMRDHGAAPGDVPDPYYGGADGFDEVLDMLEDASGGLLDALIARTGA